MTHEEARIMSECNRNGIRVYPVNEYGKYRLYVEFNQTKYFLPKNLIKLIEGKETYRPDKKDWMDKIKELYKSYYEKLKPRG